MIAAVQLHYQPNMGVGHIKYLLALLHKPLAHFWTKFLISISMLPFLLFNPVLKDAMVALAILVIIDFVSGVMVAKKLGEEIKSAKIFRTAIKLAVYFMMISAGRLTVVAGLPYLPIDAIILTFLASTELVSIIENAGYMGYAVPKRLLNQLKDFRDKK